MGVCVVREGRSQHIPDIRLIFASSVCELGQSADNKKQVRALVSMHMHARTHTHGDGSSTHACSNTTTADSHRNPSDGQKPVTRVMMLTSDARGDVRSSSD